MAAVLQSLEIPQQRCLKVPCILRHGLKSSRGHQGRAHAVSGQAPVADSDGAHASVDYSQSVTLENVRSCLIRQEDSIIFALIERAQFLRNEAVYEPGAVPIPAYLPDGTTFSLLEYLLKDTEAVHGRIRRYTSPDEHAFFPEALPPMVLPPIRYPSVLHPAAARAVNVNDRILRHYRDHILPGITAPGDDGNYGSSAMYDVLVLQALSKRIHYGMFVAEAKYKGGRGGYDGHIARRDAAALLALLTFPDQEARVVARVRHKAETFGQDLDDAGRVRGGRYKVAPAAVADLYRDWVMPLTKEVQVAYLLRRRGG